MADHFVDSVNGSDANNGHSTDTAWATIKYAVESTGGLTAGDIVWVRRTSAFTPTANTTWSSYGAHNNPIQLIGCPRPSLSISSSDWTNGSTTVTIDDANMSHAAHCGRYISAPNSRVYLITRVISSTSIVIDTEYSGATVTNQSASIHADEDYGLFMAIDDSTWTIKCDDWMADSHALPDINYNGGAYTLYAQQRAIMVKNLRFRNCDTGEGLINGDYTPCIGCLFEQNYARQTAVGINADRCIFIGSGSYGSRVTQYGEVAYKNGAAYNYGSQAFYAAHGTIENFNIGVEMANGTYDIAGCHHLVCYNVKLGGTNGYVNINSGQYFPYVYFENFQKVLGSNRTYFRGGYFENATLTTSTTPQKKLGDDVIKITPNVDYHPVGIIPNMYKIAELRVWADTTSKSYRLWLYNSFGATLNDTTAHDNIFLKCRYLSSYDDTSEYTYSEVYSTQLDMAVAANATDWDYIEVTNIQPAGSGWIIFEIYYAGYSETGTVYIDPQLVIT